MEKLIVQGELLLELGYQPSAVIGLLMQVAEDRFTKNELDIFCNQARAVLNDPLAYKEDEIWGQISEALMTKADDTIALVDPVTYQVFGAGQIEEGAVKQMETAIRLPVAVAGALMPDAHQGYGLPIGGVLATRNAVIPYGVGVDIGCRMCLSVYDIPATDLDAAFAQYQRELIANTKFGAGAGFHGQYKADHAILEHKDFGATTFLRALKDKAYSQLGTSGGGNHFVEFGILDVAENRPEIGLNAGKYLALLSHSGSRGFGATIANHYTKLARSLCKLPKEASHLAYFDLDTAEGQEYWQAMNLAGDYASACHDVIHAKMAKAIGGQVLSKVENHHNFAWKENRQGEEWVVHRKGATPAGKGVLGIIPGSMTAPGFLVKGKGHAGSLESASHGAGRQMSRTKAEANFTREGLNQYLKQEGVKLIGGGTDEAPGAYKDIHSVMAAQTELVEVLASFQPKLVRMADDGSRED
jgi:tRNA-splicing ligase RtcB